MTGQAIVKALSGTWLSSHGMCRGPTHNDGKEPALKVTMTQVRSPTISLTPQRAASRHASARLKPARPPNLFQLTST
jgi:hypothetical protein